MSLTRLLAGLTLALASLSGSFTYAAEEAGASTVTVGDGALEFKAPAAWEKRKPKINFIEAEFAAPAVGEDKTEVRITIMGAGGDVEANLERWRKQFQTAAGEALTKEQAKVEKVKVAGQDVHLIDLAGTYLDKPFPAAEKATPRENWRMLGAILVTEKAGNYFVKLYGPAAAVAAQEAAFKDFIHSAQVKAVATEEKK